MRSHRFAFRSPFSLFLGLVALLFTTLAAIALVNCGNTDVKGNFNGMTGSAQVTVSDPPTTCSAPQGDFLHVFITIRSVEAHTSAAADDSSPGWQELTPQLNSQPKQVDLLGQPTNGCFLAELGSTSGLPAGDFQQLRVMLVANNASPGSVPGPNACGAAFNCVVLKDGSTHTLDLSSQADTGLKIPPGQVVGGPIHVGPGQVVDINIDFNACASIVAEGGGQFRLKPALTAEQVSTVAGIAGQVVDSVTGQPIAGAMVALEMPDANSIDRVFMQAATDSSGNFNFCPLPNGAAFDIVVDALPSSGTAYNATLVLHVPGGTKFAKPIPLIAETAATPGASTGPGTIQGFVTAIASGTTGASIDAATSALQTVSLSGGGSVTVTVLPVDSSIPNLAIPTTPPTACPSGSPTGANCAQYTLVLPASNPNVGVFSAGVVTFTAPASGPVAYAVEARAFAPMSGGTPICSPSTQPVSKDTTGAALQVTPGKTTAAQRIDFSGCM